MRMRALSLPLAIAALGIAGCGDSEESSSTTAAEAEAEAPVVDATAFEDCIYSGSLDVGIYEPVKQPDPELADAAPDADFFEAGKGDDGIVAFYVFADEAAAGEFAGEFEQTFSDFGADLTSGAGIEDVTGFMETVDNVALGLIPFSADKEAELTEEATADVSTCLEESAAG